jgi:hypothetical protein
MRINYTILKDLLRKSTVILIVLALVQVLYFSEQPVIPETLEEYTKINGSNPIRFSADSGFYEQGFSLEMEAEGILPKGAQIRYTLDGSEPGIRSTLYEGPVRLEVPDAPAGTDKKSVPDQNTDAEKDTAAGAGDSQTENMLRTDEKGIETEERAEEWTEERTEGWTEAVFDSEADDDSEEMGESLSSGGRQETDTGGASYLADNPAAGTRVYTVRAKIICGEEETRTQYAVYGIQK